MSGAVGNRTEALDVDRLTEALHSLHMPMPWRWWDREKGDTTGTSVEFAAAIVREGAVGNRTEQAVRGAVSLLNVPRLAESFAAHQYLHDGVVVHRPRCSCGWSRRGYGASKKALYDWSIHAAIAARDWLVSQ